MGATTTTSQRIEQALQAAIQRATSNEAPPLLRDALRAAVFPGGARVRPQLCLAVSGACGDGAPAIADAAGAAIELLHCASLVHDDLPCFDDADTRRGRPSIHCAFGEPIAVLTGDALIVLAFETVARSCAAVPQLLPTLISILARAAGAPKGLAAGQAWESEPNPVLDDYHQAKTGALFVAATTAGATAAGGDPAPWRTLGERIGQAYQVADDLRDAASDPEEVGKPTLRDAELLRPNAVAELGVEGALQRLHQLLQEASASIPACRGEQTLRDLIGMQAKRLIPKSLAQTAA